MKIPREKHINRYYPNRCMNNHSYLLNDKFYDICPYDNKDMYPYLECNHERLESERLDKQFLEDLYDFEPDEFD